MKMIKIAGLYIYIGLFIFGFYSLFKLDYPSAMFTFGFLTIVSVIIVIASRHKDTNDDDDEEPPLGI